VQTVTYALLFYGLFWEKGMVKKVKVEAEVKD
jgi:hypothetical protein